MAATPESDLGTAAGTSAAALDIIIVGGGIAGLTAANALAQIGHDVKVLEKSKFKREAGFMITIGSGGCRVLENIGFDFGKARPVNVDNVTRYNGRTLKLRTNIPTQKHSKKNAQQPRTFYRPDLHNELKRLALSGRRGKKSPTLMLGCAVEAVDIEAGTVTLQDGRVMKADLIIAADGERSLVKAAFNDPDSLRQSAFKIFRAIIPTEKITEDEIGKELMSMTRNKFAMFQVDDKIVSWFEGRDGLLQDLECGYLIPRGEKATPPEQSKAAMLSKMSRLHPHLLHVLNHATSVTDWEVYNSLPLPHLFKHRALLIGDAAHSMMPTTGQGGSQSIEDAGALMVLLDPASFSGKGPKPRPEELQKRLQIYQDLRKDRLAVIMALSAVMIGEEPDLRKHRPKHFINRTDIKNGDEHAEFLYNYDIYEEATKALEKAEKPRARL